MAQCAKKTCSVFFVHAYRLKYDLIILVCLFFRRFFFVPYCFDFSMIIFLGSSESYIIFSCLSLTLPRFGWIKLRISYIHPFIPYLYIMVYKPIPYNMNWYISVLRPRLHWPVHSVQEIVLFILFHLSASTSLSLSLSLSWSVYTYSVKFYFTFSQKNLQVIHFSCRSFSWKPKPITFYSSHSRSTNYGVFGVINMCLYEIK